MSGLEVLLRSLELGEAGRDVFWGSSLETPLPSVFGGQLLAQSIIAASRTATSHVPYSLHANFLAPCDSQIPIVYSVQRCRDGRHQAMRRVDAFQLEELVFTALVSLLDSEMETMEHQFAMPNTPGPHQALSGDKLLNLVQDRMKKEGRYFFSGTHGLELRPIEFNRYLGKPTADHRFHLWIRATDLLPIDPVIHRAVLAFGSDMTLLDASLIPHRRSFYDGSIRPASLDHAIWFHRSFRADEWLLFAQDSPTLANGRGFCRGQIFSNEGSLVASVAQEGLLREARRDL